MESPSIKIFLKTLFYNPLEVIRHLLTLSFFHFFSFTVKVFFIICGQSNIKVVMPLNLIFLVELKQYIGTINIIHMRCC